MAGGWLGCHRANPPDEDEIKVRSSCMQTSVLINRIDRTSQSVDGGEHLSQ